MKNYFKNAIVRRPCPQMINGISSAGLGKPDFNLALKQHEKYIEILQQCGLHVEILDALNDFPDSTFIEDVAICTPHCAIISNPGAASRNGETEKMKVILKKYFLDIEQIVFPGTLDGGDVMKVGNHYFIGISGRTNHDGADQLLKILNKYGMTGSKIELYKVLHLKTGLSYIENNNLLISGEFIIHSDFESYHKIIIDPSDSYSANSLWINDFVLVPLGYPKTVQRIKDKGYFVLELDVSEFRKLDGGLSCLSLRF
jgi:dimethylargininase